MGCLYQLNWPYISQCIQALEYHINPILSTIILLIKIIKVFTTFIENVFMSCVCVSARHICTGGIWGHKICWKQTVILRRSCELPQHSFWKSNSYPPQKQLIFWSTFPVHFLIKFYTQHVCTDMYVFHM